MLFPVLWGLLFFSSASALPLYTLDSMENTQVTFDNQAVFQMDFLDQQAIFDWTTGDVLEIFNTFPALLFPVSTQLRNGLSIVIPTVRIKNITRNSEILARLTSIPALGSLKIASVDFPSRSITLSDATDWSICPDDEDLLNLWGLNDYVLVGHNIGLKSSIFECVLLNANQQALIRAHQQ